MTTIRLPKDLPFQEPLRIGLPFHGLVLGLRGNAELELPDGSDMTYRQSLNGDAVVMRGAAASQTEEVVDGNYRWRNYGLLSGNDRRLGGKALGPYGWIYCDGTNNWRMSLEFSEADGSNQITISVYLEDSFGRFSSPPVDCSRRLLDSLTFTPRLYNGNDAPVPAGGTGTNYYAKARTLTHSRDGSVSVINFAGLHYWFATGVRRWTVGAFDSQLPCTIENSYFDAIAAGDTKSTSYGYHTALTILVGGIGSLAEGSVGNGVSASIAILKTADQLITEQLVELTNYSYTEIDSNEFGELEYELDCTLSGTFAVAFLHVAAPSGEIVPVSFTETYARDYFIYRNEMVDDKDITDSQITRTYTLRIGATTITATHSISLYENEDTDELESTVLEDGTEVDVLSVPQWAVICDRFSSTSAIDTNPTYTFDMNWSGQNKTYGSLLFWARGIDGAASDANRKSMLVSLVDGTTEIVDKPGDWGRSWNYSVLSGKNCAHNPLSGQFWYDLTVAPNYAGSYSLSSASITDINNETLGSYV